MTTQYRFSEIKKDIADLIDQVAADPELTEAEALRVIASLDLSIASLDHAYALRDAVGRLAGMEGGTVREKAGRLKYYWQKVNL